MNAKSIVAVVLLFALCGLSTAQRYSIRITNNTNLRAEASLQGRIVETAPANSTLQVVGQFGRWLEIDHNGRKVWMASWVSHSSVGDGQQSGAQPASDIDNCCFVNRQCHSDQEWVDGYWAFQANQCPAPARSQPRTSAQPATTAPAAIPEGVDNCCHLGWQCQGGGDWQKGFFAFQSNQCEHQGVAIDGSGAFVIQAKAALDLLKTRAPYWYDYSINALDRIQQSTDGWLYGTYGHGRTFFVADGSGNLDESSLIWFASSIVHEACHINQYHAIYHNRARPPITTEEAELECTRFMREAANVIDPHNRFSSWLQTLINNIHSQEFQWWN